MSLVVVMLLSLVTLVYGQEAIPDEWLITVPRDCDVDNLAGNFREAFHLEVVRFYHFEEFTTIYVRGGEPTVLEAVRSHHNEVSLLEANTRVYAAQTCQSTPHPGVWGLDRIDQRDALTYSDPTNNSAQYESGLDTGAGSTAYVLDTGIRVTHSEFEGRAVWGHSAGFYGTEDDNGHGTHVAGTLGSAAYGVAAGVRLVACKCLNQFGSGATADIIECVNWVTTEQHAPGERSVINLSLMGGVSVSLDNAVQAAIDANISVVTAAGDSNGDACFASPGRVSDVINVGATDVDDQSADYTNWGACVDVFAPGTSILSTWINSDTDSNTFTGTSMACPHMAGAVARYQSTQPAAPTPADVRAYINATATAGVIRFRENHETSPNLLLYSPCELD